MQAEGTNAPPVASSETQTSAQTQTPSQAEIKLEDAPILFNDNPKTQAPAPETPLEAPKNLKEKLIKKIDTSEAASKISGLFQGMDGVKRTAGIDYRDSFYYKAKVRVISIEVITPCDTSFISLPTLPSVVPLAGGSAASRLNTYVTTAIGEEQRKTSIVQSTASPTYNELFIFHKIKTVHQPMTFTLYSRPTLSQISADHAIGTAKLNLGDVHLNRGRPNDFTITLLYNDAKHVDHKVGELKVCITPLDFGNLKQLKKGKKAYDIEVGPLLSFKGQFPRGDNYTRYEGPANPESVSTVLSSLSKQDEAVNKPQVNKKDMEWRVSLMVGICTDQTRMEEHKQRKIKKGKTANDPVTIENLSVYTLPKVSLQAGPNAQVQHITPTILYVQPFRSGESNLNYVFVSYSFIIPQLQATPSSDASDSKPSSETEITYTVDSASYTFYIPTITSPTRWMYCSCNGFQSLNTEESFTGIQPVWSQLIQSHKQHKHVHLFVSGGDQLYTDSVDYGQGVMRLPSIIEWAAKVRKEGSARVEKKYLSLQENSALQDPFTEDMRREVTGFLLRHYLRHFNEEGFRDALATIPSLMSWDDHDIFDGWGSYPWQLQGSVVFQNIYLIARKYYLLFQHHTTDTRLKNLFQEIKKNKREDDTMYVGYDISIPGTKWGARINKEQLLAQERAERAANSAVANSVDSPAMNSPASSSTPASPAVGNEEGEQKNKRLSLLSRKSGPLPLLSRKKKVKKVKKVKVKRKKGLQVDQIVAVDPNDKENSIRINQDLKEVKSVNEVLNEHQDAQNIKETLGPDEEEVEEEIEEEVEVDEDEEGTASESESSLKKSSESNLSKSSDSSKALEPDTTKAPESSETKAPESSETKVPEASETKAPESSGTKASESGETKAPESSSTKASESLPPAEDRTNGSVSWIVRIDDGETILFGPDCRTHRSVSCVTPEAIWNAMFHKLIHLFVLPTLEQTSPLLNIARSTSSSSGLALQNLSGNTSSNVGPVLSSIVQSLQKKYKSSLHLQVAVCLSVPVVWPNLEKLSFFQDAVDNSNVLSAVVSKFSNQKNDFGLMELRDDVADHWSTPLHSPERNLMLTSLSEISNSFSLRSTLFGGDVHLAAAGIIYPALAPGAKLQTKGDALGGDWIWQIVSSPIGNEPSNIGAFLAYLEMMGKKEQECGSGMVMKTIRWRDVDGGPSKIGFIAKRNCVIIERSNGTGTPVANEEEEIEEKVDEKDAKAKKGIRRGFMKGARGIAGKISNSNSNESSPSAQRKVELKDQKGSLKLQLIVERSQQQVNSNQIHKEGKNKADDKNAKKDDDLYLAIPPFAGSYVIDEL
eukprot:TRINITY_DN6597_c0_g1_i1.p1 TRINITY_DN6597_c0_g1~~TRINITY_DN6597_c0_g1_i1.p1  ORF type:complete len:1332 (-),score=376.08 TRINITY_DN6597_c0_g1_i1:34-4029(-)